jgi:hypothetical protein
MERGGCWRLLEDEEGAVERVMDSGGCWRLLKDGEGVCGHI